jgi:DNA primase
VLHEIHGKKDGARTWGHNLFFRFPILAHRPSRDFISRCIDHFARRIHLNELDEDIQRAKGLAGENDAAVDQLLNLVRERQIEHAAIESDGAELAEEVENIERVWGRNPVKSQDAAMQHSSSFMLR